MTAAAPRARTSPTLPVLPLAVGAAIIAGAVIGVATSHVATPSAAFFLIAPLALWSLVMPLRWLPVVALLCVALLPLENVGSPTWLRNVPVAAIPLGALMLRAPVMRPLPKARVALALALAVWIVISLALAQTDDASGLLRGSAWTATFLIGVAFTAATPRRLPSRDGIELAVIWIIAGLALFAIVETRILHANPLLDHLYASGSPPLLQKWGGGYRATTTLGHPLVNGLVLSCGLVLAVGRGLLDEERRVSLGIASLILAGGLLSTQARSAFLAAGLGMAILLFTSAPSRGVRLAKVAVAGVMVIGALAAMQTLASRLGSSEAERSAGDRAALPGLVVSAMRQTGPFGAGPGVGADFIVRERLASTTKSQKLESAAAEMVVGTGIPGALLMVLLVGSVALSAIRSPRHVPAGATIVTFGVVAAGFNAFEAHPKVLVLLGVLIVLATARTPEDDAAGSDDAAAVGGAAEDPAPTTRPALTPAA